jgi:hypothetical protein
MFQAKSSMDAIPNRIMMKSPGNGAERWRTDFLGTHGGSAVIPEPQAFLVEMQSNDEILPHFHEVDQFQIFVAGAGGMGRGDAVQPVTLHYADRYTGYGPIHAGPQGYSYFTLRARTDPGPVYLHKPGYRERLKPSKKRHSTAQVALCTTPVLTYLKDVTCESIMGGPAVFDDGLAAWLLRAGANLQITCPDPQGSGGQYLLVLSGSLELDGVSYPRWSTIFISPDHACLQFKAETQGCEVMVLQFGAQGA